MPIIDGCIRCSSCRETKPLAEYQPSVVRVGCGVCRPCKQKAKRAYEQLNRDKANSAQRRRRARRADSARAVRREWYAANKDRHRSYALGGRYGITLQQYERILVAQGGRCACCGAASNRNGKRLFVDHDHETGAVRGLLCLKCNAGIGALGDGLTGVGLALVYLSREVTAGLSAGLLF